MECHSPLTIKRPGSLLIEDDYIKVACGHCPACDLIRINHWKTRAKAELKYSLNGFFITLTYNNDHLPFDPETGISTLRKIDYQRFLKKVRSRYSYELKNSLAFISKRKSIRYILCGEYGSKNSRPHYHICLFNVPAFAGVSVKNHLIDVCSQAWRDENKNSMGNIYVGELKMGAIDYVVSYIAGKRFGFDGRGRQVPFLEMSRRPGIGYDYIERMSDYHHSSAERMLTMPKNFNNKSMPTYFKKKLFNNAELRQIANDLKEQFEDRRIKEDAEYLLQGVDPLEARKARMAHEAKRMQYKKTKKFRK